MLLARPGGTVHMSPSRPDFGWVARSYDELRPADAKWWEVFELLTSDGLATAWQVQRGPRPSR